MLPLAHHWSPRERVLGLVALVNFAIAIAAVFVRGDSRPNASTTFAPAWHWRQAKYIDLTHAIEPHMPIWSAFATPKVGNAVAGNAVDGFIEAGEPFSYGRHGFVATSVTLPTDQLGTQLDPPAHWNEYGATISDIPPTVSLRPLAIIDITESVGADPGYHAQVSDVLAYEAAHGTLPWGSVVLFRSGWSKNWAAEATAPSAAFPGVALETLGFLHKERHILVHGHEPLDTDMTPSLEGEAWLMHHNYMQIEGAAHLEGLPAAGCMISIGFAKIAGGTGGYARLVAICPPDSPVGVTVDEQPGAPLPQSKFPLRRDEAGMMVPDEAAVPTQYCEEGTAALGCPLPL